MSTMYDDLIWKEHWEESNHKQMIKEMAEQQEEMRRISMAINPRPTAMKPRPTPPPPPPRRSSVSNEKVLKAKIEMLEKILDGIWEVHEAKQKANPHAVTDYSTAGKFAVEAYRLYVADKAKSELMK